MAEKSKMSEAAGCALGLGGLMLAVTVISGIIEVVKHYPAIMSIGGTVSGGLFGALAGAGIGVILPQLGRYYRTKGAIGPLPCGAYLSGARGLRATYLGVTEEKEGNARKAWIRPTVATVLLCIVLFAGAQLTEDAYKSAHPDDKAPAQKKGESATIARPATGLGERSGDRGGPIRFNGLYRDWGDNSSTFKAKGFRDYRTYHEYLRFYADGTVLYTVSKDAPAYVMRFLNKNFARSQGRYSLTDKADRITFSIGTQSETVDYEGTVGPEMLRLHSHSNVNGREASTEFRYIEVNGL
jgi:hypothetical protein